MPDDQIQQQLGIQRVVFRATGDKGFAIARERLGIDRIEHEAVVLQ
jgi:hypothetical protein